MLAREVRHGIRRPMSRLDSCRIASAAAGRQRSDRMVSNQRAEAVKRRKVVADVFNTSVGTTFGEVLNDDLSMGATPDAHNVASAPRNSDRRIVTPVAAMRKVFKEVGPGG